MKVVKFKNQQEMVNFLVEGGTITSTYNPKFQLRFVDGTLRNQDGVVNNVLDLKYELFVGVDVVHIQNFLNHYKISEDNYCVSIEGPIAAMINALDLAVACLEANGIEDGIAIQEFKRVLNLVENPS